MKWTLAHLLPTVAVITAGCGTAQPPPLTDVQKTDIAVEVRAIFDDLIAAVNEHDVDQIMSHLLNSDELHHAGGGTMFTGWQSLYNAVAIWHADPSNSAWSANMDEVAIGACPSNRPKGCCGSAT
jgi:hypothetical protein